MTIKTEGVHAGEFLHSEANGSRSREEVVICAGSGRLAAGTLIALITATNALTPTAKPGNAGNGIIGSVTVSSAAVSGIYTLKIVEAAANGGEFELLNAESYPIGEGVVGQPYNGNGLAFTLSDGSTDFVVGDSFTLNVKANLGEHTAYDDDGTDDGRRAATGILYAPVDATLNDVRAVSVARDAEVVERLLTGLDANGRADLQAKGIIIRP
jgi:hypothetical protein